jgi:pyruvate kinase
MAREQQGRTKIVSTLGPATADPETLTLLIRSGVDVVRLNFSHGTHEDHLLMLTRVREAARRMGREIGVLQDLQGPKIRIGTIAAPSVELKAGEAFRITTSPVEGDASRVSTTYHHLPRDVSPGDRILLDDGKIRLSVTAVRGEEVECEVVVGGKLSSHKGINLPGVRVSAPSCTPKDLEDLTFGLRQDVDYVALSFVRSGDDIRQLRHAIRERRGEVQVIAKIEKPEAVERIDSIIAAADGIMVARGDLGVEMPPEDVPLLQKRIVAKCNAAGKPVIIATQMLESMIASPTPTRAEANDVANAVLDGADAVMLSGETSVGKYPVEAVAMMDRIIIRAEAEPSGGAVAIAGGAVGDRHDALAQAACILAGQMNAAAIVVVTRSGQTARSLSRYRPATPVVAVTAEAKSLRMLALVRGVRGLVMENLYTDSDTAVRRIREALTSQGLVSAGEYVVLLGGLPFLAKGSTNFIKVEQIS